MNMRRKLPKRLRLKMMRRNRLRSRASVSRHKMKAMKTGRSSPNKRTMKMRRKLPKRLRLKMMRNKWTMSQQLQRRWLNYNMLALSKMSR